MCIGVIQPTLSFNGFQWKSQPFLVKKNIPGSYLHLRKLISDGFIPNSSLVEFKYESIQQTFKLTSTGYPLNICANSYQSNTIEVNEHV